MKLFLVGRIPHQGNKRLFSFQTSGGSSGYLTRVVSGSEHVRRQQLELHHQESTSDLQCFSASHIIQ